MQIVELKNRLHSPSQIHLGYYYRLQDEDGRTALILILATPLERTKRPKAFWYVNVEQPLPRPQMAYCSEVGLIPSDNGTEATSFLTACPALGKAHDTTFRTFLKMLHELLNHVSEPSP